MEQRSKVRSTGFISHPSMASQHFCLWDDNYPECPARCAEILKRCSSLNLLERCQNIPYRFATKEEIHLLHSPELTALLEECEKKGNEELEDICSRYDSVYISPETYQMALLAAGCAMNLVKAVCVNDVKNGMAVIRPPGHHAMHSAYCGYCFFNNVALAADYAIRTFDLKRILVVDWDVHHGQATQQMFYSNPRVLYFSIHRFEHGTFWPNLKESNSNYVGEGEGRGFNINVPLNRTGLGNADYLSIFHQILLPITVEYQPELILVSAGYDAAIGCFEGEMVVTPACYAHLVNSLSHFAEGKIAVILEGGYFSSSLAESAALTLRALLGDCCPNIGPIGNVDETVRETILNVMYYHRPYWNCFKVNDISDNSSELLNQYSSSFIPRLKFEYVEEVLEKFPTRSCYPSRSEESIIYYKEKVQTLINTTKLLSTKYYCLPYSTSVSHNFEQILSMFKEEDILKISESADVASVVASSVMGNITRSVIIDRSSVGNRHISETIINSLKNNFGIEKIMYVDFNSHKVMNASKDLLIFNFNESNEQDLEVENKYIINLKLCDTFTDTDYVTYWLRILLPISYQYDPQIILASFRFNLNISPTTYAYLLHWLTSMAYGRVIFIADYNSGNEHEVLSIRNCVQVLQKVPVGLPIPSQVAPKYSINSLKILIEKLKKVWGNLDYLVTYIPEEAKNVF